MKRSTRVAVGLLAVLSLSCAEKPAAPPPPAAAPAPAPRVVPAGEEPLQGEEQAVLTDPPTVPPPITRKHATKVVVHLEVKEVVQRLADGVEFTFWTFGGKVPGKFIRVREGDLVEFHLDNHPDNKMPHNIDLHAVNGPGGGAASSFTAPGHSSIFTFRVLNPGLYVYHCATAPVAMHIGNGMYGLILVEPREGLPKVDREFYVMQGEFYTKGAYGDRGLQPFSMEKTIEERPDYVVFNGAVGALMEAGALRAKVGEKVRLYVGNGGPNLISSFHIIGEIFDSVRTEAGRVETQDVQTTLIPSGGATQVELKLDTAGDYLLVDHSISRAFNKGALGALKVEGPENKAVYSGKITDEVYLPEGVKMRVSEGEAPRPPAARTKPERIAAGKQVYTVNCIACHQATGQGIPNAFPPLAASDFLNADMKRAVQVVTAGLSGKITVNGKEFNSVMPAWQLSDEDVANVLTYVSSEWGNKGEEFTPAFVAKNRAAPGSVVAPGAH